MSNYHIDLLSENDFFAWDDFVYRHDHGCYYHLSGWKTIVERAYSLKTYFLLCRDSRDHLVGLLPLVHLKHLIFGNTLVSMPYLDGGGVLTDSLEVREVLLEAAVRIAKAKNNANIELHELYSESLATPPSSTFPKLRLVLSLPGSSDLLFKGFPSKLRSQLRKPIKEGLRFALGGVEKIADFFQVFAVNMRDLGSPVHSHSFFSWITSVLHGYCKVGVVYRTNQPVAAGIIFIFRNTVSLPWASSLRAYNKLAPNMMLYGEFLRYAADQGYEYFDFGRSSKGSGSYLFKEQWGAQPYPLNWQFMPAQPKSDLSDNKDRFSPLIKLWQRLPIPLTLLFGPRIRKYIAL